MDERRILEAILQLGVLVFSLSFHEFGHAWAATRLGDPTPRMLGRLTIDPRAHVHPIGTILFPLLMIFFPGLPLIGWAKPVPVTGENFVKPRRDMSLVAVAGPSMNLLIALSSLILLSVAAKARFFGMDALTQANFVRLMMMFLMINFYLAAFNLLPIPPLDGGWLLKSILPGPLAYKVSQLEPYSVILIYVLLQFGILNLIFIPISLLLEWSMEMAGLGGLSHFMGI